MIYWTLLSILLPFGTLIGCWTATKIFPICTSIRNTNGEMMVQCVALCLPAAERGQGLLRKLLLNVSLHFGSSFFYAFEQTELVGRALQVVQGVRGLEVGVAIEIVCQEADALHIGEEGYGIGQIFNFDGGEETFSSCEITSCEGFKDVETEGDVVEIGIVFARGVGCGAEEVAEV